MTDSPEDTGKKQRYSPEWEAQKFKPGQSGNPNGRPKGARSKLTETFLNDALEAWNTNGKEALEKMAAEKPGDFAKMIATIIPKEDKLEHTGKDGAALPAPVINVTTSSPSP